MAQDENQDRDYPHQAITTNGEQTTSAAEESSHPSNGDQRKTSSAAKIAASRENGKRSNGPTRRKGKRKVAGTATNMDFLPVNLSRLGTLALRSGGPIRTWLRVSGNITNPLATLKDY